MIINKANFFVKSQNKSCIFNGSRLVSVNKRYSRYECSEVGHILKEHYNKLYE